jgi:metal-responsive CopG/Arc/MetJ family transcriptional regulator
MEDDLRIEGTTVVYFQHDVENKLAEIRHSGDVDISSYSHTCLPESHSCVDTMQVRGKAGSIRKMITQLRNIHDVDRVVFVSAPDREHGCC